VNQMRSPALRITPEPAPIEVSDATESCTFAFMDADFVRGFRGKNLPFFQTLRAKHPSALVHVTLTYSEVVTGKHVEENLSVSHRWMNPDDPDPDGEQLKAIQNFLCSADGEKIKRVWIDAQSMPQDQPRGSRSDVDTKAFKTMLAQVNMLFLGTRVLILLDLSYVSRFWTQFEAWLSMQFATPRGLKSAVGTKNERHHIVCIQNAAAQSEAFTKMLVDQWAKKTPRQAFEFLSKPDVTVTNASDKEGQLPKIEKLDETVQSAFAATGRQLQGQVAAAEAAVARAKAAVQAWEADNCAIATPQHPLKVTAERAQVEMAAARVTKAHHEAAIMRGVTPLTMKRDELMQEVERERKEKEAVATAAAQVEAAAKAEAKAEAAAKAEAKAAAKAEAKAAYDALPERAKTAKAVCPCCTCDDGHHLYGCVPTSHYYILAGCTHLCLCPQQECDSMCEGNGCDHCIANCPVFWLCGTFALQSRDRQFKDYIYGNVFCWEYKSWESATA